jgi:hypothetical protein
MKNSNDSIGNRTRDLPTCRAVLQPTAPPRVPLFIYSLIMHSTDFFSTTDKLFTNSFVRCELELPCVALQLTATPLHGRHRTISFQIILPPPAYVTTFQSSQSFIHAVHTNVIIIDKCTITSKVKNVLAWLA